MYCLLNKGATNLQNIRLIPIRFDTRDRIIDRMELVNVIMVYFSCSIAVTRLKIVMATGSK